MLVNAIIDVCVSNIERAGAVNIRWVSALQKPSAVRVFFAEESQIRMLAVLRAQQREILGARI